METEIEKNHVSSVDFHFICRICFVRSELRLFEEEKCLWDLFQSLMKIEVLPTVGFPKKVCSDCMDKLRDIALFIEVSRYTNLYFVNNVISEEDGDYYDNGKSKYCRCCFSTTHLSPFETRMSLVKLFREITEIDVTTSTDMNSICDRCINELEKTSSFLNLSERNNKILEKLANVEMKKKVLNTDEHATGSSEANILDNSMYRSSESFIVKHEFQHLHTTFDIKNEVPDEDHIIFNGSLDTKQFRCDDCNKRFAHKSSLQTHLLTHTGEKPFKCDYCDKQFSRKVILRNHFLTHTGEKPFECDYCDKRFAFRSKMRRHLLTHTGEKPFKCDDCDRRFALRGNLRRHSLTHTRESIRMSLLQQNIHS